MHGLKGWRRRHSFACQEDLNTLNPHGLWSTAIYFCGVTPICHISHPSTWFFGLSGSITCCPRLGAASEALTCNQRPACLCQGSTVHCQLRKDWTVYVLGLVCGGFSQQESSGVFLSMGHNGFSSPMKHYSESLSHNTPPSPVKAEPGHHWRYGTDGGLKRGGMWKNTE